MRISVGDVTADDALQARAVMSESTIAEYAEAMAAGVTFPPVTVFHDGERYWLADGFHRLAAAERAGMDALAAEVKPGTARDARLYATGANATHGLRRTNADKRRAVLTILEDPEWSEWSDREIARQCGVTHPFVAKLRRPASGNGYQSIGDDGLTDELREMANRIVAQIADIAEDYHDLETRLPADQYRAFLIHEYGHDVSNAFMRIYGAMARGDEEEMINAFLDASYRIDPETGDPYPSPLVRALSRPRTDTAQAPAS